jgi:3-hydroxyacyl-[acyl-carrier-protein] dehydratase
MFRDITKIIPHRNPMVMIDGYEKIDENRAFSEKTFLPGDYGCHNGTVLESVLIECVAQTVAAHFGYNEMIENSKNQMFGMLVSVDTFYFFQKLSENAKIQITIHKKDQVGDFNIYDSRITALEKLIAEGEIKVFKSHEE